MNTKKNTGKSNRTGKPHARQGDRISSRSRRRSKEAARRRQKRRLIQGLILGFFACILVFSIYQLASIFLTYHSGDKEYEDLQQYVLDKPVLPEAVTGGLSSSEDSEEATDASLVPMTRIDLASLQEINSEAIGWIEIPDTVISYPMVHTDNDTYYLTHTFKKESNRVGSIFVEALNHADFSDLHTIIYGHNMKNGSMFATLKNYNTKSYWQAHPYIYIDLEDNSHCYQIFSCYQADISDQCYTIGYEKDVSAEVYQQFLDHLKNSSLFDTGVEVTAEDKVITLSTCTNSGRNRFVVHAKKLY